MSLKLYNTLTRKKETFKPISKNSVGMYVCGPTIYDYAHIGNLRAYVFSDVLRRFLKFSGYNVKEVMNLTDVDDKTIKGSIKAKESLRKFTEKYEKLFLEDIKAMNIERPDVMPRATEHIKEMVELVKKLLDKGIAYKTNDGIYFSIKKFKDYGKLSKVKVKELKQGASERVQKDEYDKEDANDFALWKFYDKSDGEVFWNTEIGKGRPGWHIECSAMSMKYLGESFDIHAGGVDLIFPHHENEIAQSEAATGKKFVNYWLHNEWILVNGEKMSKSKGNFYKLKDITDKKFSPMDLRYFFLSKIYNEQLNFTWNNMENARNSLERLKNIILSLNQGQKVNNKNIDNAKKQFTEIMNDNLNTSRALSFLWEILRDEKLSEGEKYELSMEFDKVLGLNLSVEENIKIPREVEKLAKEREEMRKKKNFKEADNIRNRIKKLGYWVNDTEDGTQIKKL
ncbi:MAG TPA: cysteine--tRNA ligase [Patescibacteria group bacterium]|nr:cysteine--tRNA ligase [Patescibacteria group bacterium]